MTSERGSSREFTFYAGAASGSCRKALRQLLVEDVMINYATQNNQPWDGIERLFVDCGGYSFMASSDTGEYQTTDAEYLDYVEGVEPELWALRDYPCEPELLQQHGRTVADHQRMTTERHVDLLGAAEDRDTPGQAVSVLQGWEIDDYLAHLDTLQERGALTDYVGIGSVCRRGREQEIRRVLLAVRDALPSRCDLHAFGVKVSVLQLTGVLEALTSADSQAFEFEARYNNDPCDWRVVGLEYLKYRQRLEEILTDDTPGTTQTRIGEVRSA